MDIGMETKEMTPTQLREHYKREGWVGPFELVDAEEMRSALAPKIAKAVRADEPSPVYGMKTKRDLHLHVPEVLDVFLREGMIAPLLPILGDDFLLWRTNVFNKAPQSQLEGGESLQLAGDQAKPVGELGWHQDGNYPAPYADESGERIQALYPADESLHDPSCWLAITDSTRENGCLRFLRHSHRLGEVGYTECDSDDPRKVFPFINVRLEIDVPTPDDIVEMPLKAGSFVIFSNRLIHASAANGTEQSRIGIAARFTPNSTRVYPKLRDGLDPQNYPMDNYFCVQAAGVDRFGHNRILSPYANVERLATDSGSDASHLCLHPGQHVKRGCG